MELQVKATVEEVKKVQEKWAIGLLAQDGEYVTIKIFTDYAPSIFQIGMLFGIYGMETAMKAKIKSQFPA